MDHAREILDFWFGREAFDLPRLQERMQFWFGGDSETPEMRLARDHEIRRHFRPLAARAAAGELDSWAASPQQRLALILLLDQIPRNIHRGKPAAFANDDRAVALSMEGILQAADATLDPVRRIFFYLPLEHSERLEVQDESVAAFRVLRDESPQALRPVFENTLAYAQRHRDVIQRFGRFPHRNATLARAATQQEIDWLAAGGDDFS